MTSALHLLHALMNTQNILVSRFLFHRVWRSDSVGHLKKASTQQLLSNKKSREPQSVPPNFIHKNVVSAGAWKIFW
jgi:hypothetical protein